MSVSIVVNTFKSMIDALLAMFTQGAHGATSNLTYAQAAHLPQTDAPIHPSLEDRLWSMQQEVVKVVREMLTEEKSFTDADAGPMTMKDSLWNIQRS